MKQVLSFITKENIDSLLKSFKKERKILTTTWSVNPWVECDYIPDFIDYLARDVLQIINNEEVYQPKYLLKTQLQDLGLEIDKELYEKIIDAENSFRD